MLPQDRRLTLVIELILDMADLLERGTRPITEKQIEGMRDEAKKIHTRAVKLHNDGVE